MHEIWCKPMRREVQLFFDRDRTMLRRMLPARVVCIASKSNKDSHHEGGVVGPSCGRARPHTAREHSNTFFVSSCLRGENPCLLIIRAKRTLRVVLGVMRRGAAFRGRADVSGGFSV